MGIYDVTPTWLNANFQSASKAHPKYFICKDPYTNYQTSLSFQLGGDSKNHYQTPTIKEYKGIVIFSLTAPSQSRRQSIDTKPGPPCVLIAAHQSPRGCDL